MQSEWMNQFVFPEQLLCTVLGTLGASLKEIIMSVKLIPIVGHSRSMYWEPSVRWVQALALSSPMKKIMLEVTTVGKTRTT